LGLEALMRFHHARRDAREDHRGIVLLEEQDRSRWNADEIARAHEVLERAFVKRRFGSYQLQAAIAAHHAIAPSFEQTNWQAIVDLYDRLYALDPSPIVALNRAAAIGMLLGPSRGLDEMRQAGLALALKDYHPFHAARGELLRLAGEIAPARAALERARELAGSAAERKLIKRQLQRVGVDDSGPETA
jgi:RNA polymerase sigma-70 factor (ECF subfamily)